MSNNIKVQHNKQQNRFYIDLVGDSKALAVLEYHLLSDKKIDFHHTYVPAIYRSKGLASLLVKAGFKWAQQQGLAIKPSCLYARKKQEELVGLKL